MKDEVLEIASKVTVNIDEGRATAAKSIRMVTDIVATICPKWFVKDFITAPPLMFSEFSRDSLSTVWDSFSPDWK